MPSISIGPTSLRDDQSHPSRSLSIPERNFLLSSLNTRIDGRTPIESRQIQLTFSRSHAQSSCTICMGSTTRVTASITCDLIPPPNPDRGNDGSILFSVSLSPMAGMGFESSSGGAENPQQKLYTNRIHRILDRVIREGGAMDTEALCVQSGEWVWKLSVDVIVLDHGGNLTDAALLSAMCALRHFRLPHVKNDGEGVEVLHSDTRQPSPLPLHHTPVSVSFALLSDSSGMDKDVTKAMLDPTEREEMVCQDQSSITFCWNVHAELCCLDFPGGCEISMSSFLALAKIAEGRGKELAKVLEEALKEADLKVHETKKTIKNVPFFQQEDEKQLDMDWEEEKEGDQNQDTPQNEGEEEERLREQALDYTIGHIAAKVKENEHTIAKPNKAAMTLTSGSSLMEALLKSAKVCKDAQNQHTTQPTDQDKPKLTNTQTQNNQKSLSITRTEAAEDEFENFAAAASTKNQSSPNVQHPVDSDEEEEVTVLHSEFGSAVDSSTSVTKKDERKKDQEKMIEDDDVDDLAMAVKKKKKGKKKGTKKK